MLIKAIPHAGNCGLEEDAHSLTEFQPDRPPRARDERRDDEQAGERPRPFQHAPKTKAPKHPRSLPLRAGHGISCPVMPAVRHATGRLILADAIVFLGSIGLGFLVWWLSPTFTGKEEP